VPERAFLALLLGLLALPSATTPARGFEPAEVRAIVWNEPDQADYPGHPGVILAHQTHRNHKGNASGTLEEHFLAVVFDPEASHLDSWEIDLDHRLQFVEVLAARRYRGDEALDLDKSHWEETPPPGVPNDTYPQRRRFVIRYPDLQPGDIVEAHVRVNIGWDPERAPVLWGVEPLAAELPVVERQVLLTVPPALGLVTAIQGWEAPIRRTYRGATVTYDLHTGHLPAYRPGQGTCSGESPPPRFVYTSAPDWTGTAKVLAREFNWASESATAAVRDSARRLIRDLPSTRERLLALLGLMDRAIHQAPDPTPLLRYWPRPAADSFEEGGADPQDWVCLLKALCTRAGLPSDVLLVSAKPGWLLEDTPNPFHFQHMALKVRLTDEEQDVIIDPLRKPAGLRVRPFPGKVKTFIPDAAKGLDSLAAIPPEQTQFNVDLYVDPATSAQEPPLHGRGAASGTGLGAAWLVQHLAKESIHRESFPQMRGWRPLLEDPTGTTLEQDWRESSAHATFRWKGSRIEAQDVGHHLLQLLPLWRVGDDSTGYCPEGPLTLTTRLHFPGTWLAGSQLRTWDGSFGCGTWRLELGFTGDGEASLEETVVWSDVAGCPGKLEGLAEARREALGL
jgi:hypothetical protein